MIIASSFKESAVSSYSLAGGLDLVAFGALFFASGFGVDFSAGFRAASAPVSSAAELADIA